MTLPATVEVDALLETVAASVVAGVGVTLAFALAVRGVIGFVELRAQERPMLAFGFAAMAVLSLLAFAGAIVIGIVIMATE
jgi:hypothetical protein